MTTVDPIVRIKRAPEHIDVTYRFRLWSGIPTEERLTNADIEHVHSGSRYATWVRDRVLDQLNAERQCAVALQQTSPYTGKWAPCRRDVAEGADLCRQHGGPPVRPPKQPTKAQLKAEVERLRKLVGEGR